MRQPGIDNSTFNIGEAVIEEWCRDIPGRSEPEAKSLKFVDLPPGAISDVHYRFRQIEPGNRNYAFPCLPKRLVTMIPWADHAADQRRLVLDSHVKAHR